MIPRSRLIAATRFGINGFGRDVEQLYREITMRRISRKSTPLLNLRRRKLPISGNAERRG